MRKPAILSIAICNPRREAKKATTSTLFACKFGAVFAEMTRAAPVTQKYKQQGFSEKGYKSGRNFKISCW